MLGTGSSLSLQASQPRGRRGWYILCPEVPKLLKALWPAVPARSALLPACGSVVLPTPWGPRASMTRPPPSQSRRPARFCSGLAPALPVILAALAVPVGELRNGGEASLECKNGGSYD